MNVALRRPMSREEFFVWAEAQDGRYEFDGMRPVAMVGGTNKHGTISANLIALLRNRLRGSSCRSMGSEGGGIAIQGNAVRYPDAAVTCSPVRGEDRLLSEPVVVFEVLSPSSRHTDLVTKPVEYAAVPSIRRYVIVEQAKAEVRGYRRTAEGDWLPTEPLRDGDTLDLPEVGVTLALADIYEDVSFGPA